MPPYLTWNDLIAAGISESQLKQWAPGDTADAHPLLDDAIAAASGEMDEYLRRRGIEVPLDTPLDPVFRRNLIALVADYRTSFADRRPQMIGDNAANARNFFEKVATGRRSAEDTDPTTPAGQTLAASGPRESLTPSTFDSAQPDSLISQMFPPLIGGSGWWWRS